MKKKIMLPAILLIFLCGCTSTTTSEEINPRNIVNIYNRFELVKEREYLSSGIKYMYVAPYSKGIELIFITENKDFPEDKFMIMARETVDDFKSLFVIGLESPIKVDLDYQPKDTVNAKNLYSVILK